MMWDPLLSDAEHTGELRVVANGEGRGAQPSVLPVAPRLRDASWRYHAAPAAELTQTGQFIDRRRDEAAGLLAAELGINVALAVPGVGPPQPSPADDGPQSDPRAANYCRPFYALGLIGKPVAVREAVWYGEEPPTASRACCCTPIKPLCGASSRISPCR